MPGAKDLHYDPGSFYRICQQTGFKIRSYNTQKEWNGLIVRTESWEPRQPQDLVRGVPDNQNVPEPRPRQPDVFLDVSTFLSADAGAGATTIMVKSSFGMSVNDVLSVMTNFDLGTVANVVISAITGNSIDIHTTPLPFFASNGNQVFDVTARSAQPTENSYPATH